MVVIVDRADRKMPMGAGSTINGHLFVASVWDPLDGAQFPDPALQIRHTRQVHRTIHAKKNTKKHPKNTTFGLVRPRSSGLLGELLIGETSRT